MKCSHGLIRNLRTTCFFGPVSIRDENPLAHGGVCEHEECASCGARRQRLVNGHHEELGDWGPTRHEREQEARAAERVVDKLISRRPEQRVLRSGDRVATVTIDQEGYLLVNGEDQPSATEVAQALPDMFKYALELRQAAQRASDLRAEVQ